MTQRPHQSQPSSAMYRAAWNIVTERGIGHVFRMAGQIVREDGAAGLIKQALQRLTQQADSSQFGFFDSPLLKPHCHEKSAWERFRGLLCPAERDASRARLMTIWNREVRTGRSVNFEPAPVGAAAADAAAFGVEILAFYLPQFHPFPENDLWWGKGFTEWANVTRSVPQFLGHHQPRLPADLSFYDLRLPETWMSQWDLATNYGIDGFCVYHYWFSGNAIMTQGLETWKRDPRIRARICLCWANENWTRTWDDLDREVLIGQNYGGEAHDLEFLSSIETYLTDERYIRRDGRPLLAVYNVESLPDPTATAKRWRDSWRKTHGEELFLYCVHSPVAKARTVPEGFDAAIEFPPAGSGEAVFRDSPPCLDEEFRGAIFDYSVVAANSKNYRPINAPRSRGVMPGWDNSARRGPAASLFVNSSPAAFSDWLQDALRYSLWFPTETGRTVFVNAWNEWGEGAYLEPDQRNGHAYGNAVRSAKDNWTAQPVIFQTGKCSMTTGAAIVHVHYPDLIPELQQCLAIIPEFDAYFSCTNTVVAGQIAAVFPEATILLVPNRGRDIAGFLALCRSLPIARYPLAVKLHTKKSVYRAGGEDWRRYLFSRLLPSVDRVEKITAKFLADPQLCALSPPGHRVCIQDDRYVGNNAGLLSQLYRICKSAPQPDDTFVAGSMFWFRPAVLDFWPLDSVAEGDFPAERGQTDGELHHAIERFMFVPALRRGFHIADIGEEFGDAPLRRFF